MQLKLYRFAENETTTLGELFIDDIFFCYTLEDKVRKKKIKGKTAIPEGKYKIVVTYSPKFDRYLPLIYNATDYKIKMNGMEFAGVRFHGGNDADDTNGCPLVAENIDKENFRIWGSKEKELTDILKKKRNIELLIINKF